MKVHDKTNESVNIDMAPRTELKEMDSFATIVDNDVTVEQWNYILATKYNAITDQPNKT